MIVEVEIEDICYFTRENFFFYFYNHKTSSINSVYSICYIVHLTYMTDSGVFFEWFVKLRVLHRICFTQFFQSQDRETEGHTELKS